MLEVNDKQKRKEQLIRELLMDFALSSQINKDQGDEERGKQTKDT